MRLDAWELQANKLEEKAVDEESGCARQQRGCCTLPSCQWTRILLFALRSLSTAGETSWRKKAVDGIGDTQEDGFVFQYLARRWRL